MQSVLYVVVDNGPSTMKHYDKHGESSETKEQTKSEGFYSRYSIRLVSSITIQRLLAAEYNNGRYQVCMVLRGAVSNTNANRTYVCVY